MTSDKFLTYKWKEGIHLNKLIFLSLIHGSGADVILQKLSLHGTMIYSIEGSFRVQEHHYLPSPILAYTWCKRLTIHMAVCFPGPESSL